MSEMSDSLTGQASLLAELLTCAIEPELKQAGITLSMFELLSTIQALRSRGTQAAVARRLAITPPSLSETVGAGVAKGLIEQVMDSKDSRAKILKLTPAGANTLKRILLVISSTEREVANGIGVDDLTHAIKVLKQANKNLARAIERSRG